MSLKVIGAGLGRTGTMSLKMALELLYDKPCFHMVELLKQPKRLKHLKTAAHTNQKHEWDSLFHGFETVVDYPCCLYYKELMEVYPDAKVILTIRDLEKWYDSAYKTIYKGKPKNLQDILRTIKNMMLHSDFRKVAPIFQHVDKIIWNGQFNGKFDDQEHAIKVHQKHIEEVKATVPADKLLIYEVKDGWEPLCQFLNMPVPDAPFPQSNSQAEFIEKIDKLIYEGKLVF